MSFTSFLVLYGVVYLLSFSLLSGLRSWLDPLGKVELPSLENPSPYELACLRDGTNGLAQLISFDLVQRGYLESAFVKQGSTVSTALRQSSAPPDVQSLRPMERVLFDFFARPRGPCNLFLSRCKTNYSLINKGILAPKQLRVYARKYESRLEQKHLFRKPRRAWLLTIAMIVVIVLLLAFGVYGMKLQYDREGGVFLLWPPLLFMLPFVMLPFFVDKRTELGKQYESEVQDKHDKYESFQAIVAALPFRPFSFKCPECDRKLHVKRGELVHTSVDCPGCQWKIEIPARYVYAREYHAHWLLAFGVHGEKVLMNSEYHDVWLLFRHLAIDLDFLPSSGGSGA